jgi:hypothetical protein
MQRRDIIREIVRRDRRKEGLAEEAVRKQAKELHEAACQQFGTWDTALRYAGVNIRHLNALKAYTRDGVRKEIRRLCLLAYGLSAKSNMRRDRRLYRAALQHFDGWRAALQAAGIDPRYAKLNSKPRQLDKRRIIETLQQRQQAELSLAWSDVCLENHALATAAKYAFGSWKKALMAAGLVPEERVDGQDVRWSRELVIDAIRSRRRE